MHQGKLTPKQRIAEKVHARNVHVFTEFSARTNIPVIISSLNFSFVVIYLRATPFYLGADNGDNSGKKPPQINSRKIISFEQMWNLSTERSCLAQIRRPHRIIPFFRNLCANEN